MILQILRAPPKAPWRISTLWWQQMKAGTPVESEQTSLTTVYLVKLSLQNKNGEVKVTKQKWRSTLQYCKYQIPNTILKMKHLIFKKVAYFQVCIAHFQNGKLGSIIILPTPSPQKKQKLHMESEKTQPLPKKRIFQSLENIIFGYTQDSPSLKLTAPLWK